MGWTTIYNFENIIPGTWSYQIQGVSLTKEIPFRFFQLPSSTINLSITLPEWQENGSDVIFIATVRADETTRIGGGTVIVSINKPDGTTENKPLFDDGAHDDQAAGDGIFGGAFENVTLGGIYGVTFTATGIYSTQSYTRNASGNFIIAPSAASFTSDYLDQGVDESGDSRYEWLEILVPVTVNSPGTYTLTGELYAGDTFMGLLKATGVWEIGSRNIALRLDSKTIFKLGLDGPYTLRNVLLTDESGITTQIKVDDPYYQTAIYAFTDFYYPEEVFLPLVNKNTLTSFTSGITFDLVDTNTKSTSAVFTDVNGYYTISDLPTGEYTLAASKTGKIFSNNPRTVNLSEDLTNQDFQEFSSFGETVFVPAGSFLMGCDPANNGGHGCPNRELPLHTVTLDAFYIDKYKVTNAKYAQCVESGNCATPAYNNSNTRSSYYGNPIYENYPVIYVDWNDATDYCTWAGKRLPSEAEWEKAARGTTVRAFPWGDQSPDCTLANFYTNGTTCVGDTSQVGIYPLGASPYGALDMAGNVWEWVNDWYSEEYYNITPSSNPPGPVSGTYKVLRSSNWREDSYGSRTSFRAPMSQYVHDNTLGFRCAVTDSSNHSPNQPSFPYPSNEAVNQSLNLTLSWIGGDQDGDSVSYDVYFELGDETPDIIVSNEQTTTYFSTEILSPESIYYWKIIAYDVHGAVTEGPVWYFTTDDGTLNPGEMVFIPAGSFPMGCDPAHNDGVTCPSNELPLHTVNLGAYYIDKYEMTNAQYAQCVSDGDCILPPSISSWDRDSYFGNPMYANYPVIYVDWYDATNYCTWAGKRLPSEAEWEKAARGTSIRAFPWGDQSPDCTLTNFYNGYCIGDTAQVGSYPMGASPYGVMDMAGNVWEWVNDWYSSSYYYVSPSSNPSGPIYGSSKVVRGGGWNYIADYLRTSTRNINYPHNHGYFAGFRCAFSQP